MLSLARCTQRLLFWSLCQRQRPKATAAESAATSEELSGQAAELKNQLSRFRLQQAETGLSGSSAMTQHTKSPSNGFGWRE
jgi:hypothetical protein